jgi:hypothetical protein
MAKLGLTLGGPGMRNPGASPRQANIPEEHPEMRSLMEMMRHNIV